jgi:hypothetical protein
LAGQVEHAPESKANEKPGRVLIGSGLSFIKEIKLERVQNI